MKASCKISLYLSFIGVIFISIGLLLSPINNQFLETNIKTTLSTNMTELRAGQEVFITLDLGSYENVKKGYNAYKATLEYDQNIFEKVIQENFVSLNHWEKLEYNPTTGEFVAIKKAGSKVLENVVQVTLKVKSTAPAGKTVIKMKDIVTSEGKKDIFLPDKNVEVNIIKEQPNISGNINNVPSNSGNTGGVNSYSSRSKPTTKAESINSEESTSLEEQNESSDEEKDLTDSEQSEKSDQDKKDSTSKDIKVENSRHNYLVLFIIIVLILLILLILFYKRRKDDENKKIRMLFIFGIVGLSYLLFAGTVYAAYNNFLFKGELNGDSRVDYADLKLLELHLINRSLLSEDLLENADMNSDGHITVTDLTLLVQKIESTLEYEVDMTDFQLSSYYPNKKDDITLTFNATVSFGSSIEKVIINGKEYVVNLDPQYPEQYSVVLNAGEISGIQEYHITKVLLDNGKEVALDYKQKVDVLKDKPTFTDYLVEEDLNDSKLYLSFNLIDQDNSLTSSSLVNIVDEDGQTVQESKIVKGTNRIEIPVVEGKIYKAFISLSYDLDTNILSQEEDHSGNELYEKDLQLIADYNISVANIITYHDGVVSTTFEKNQSFQLSFESTNHSIYEPILVKINGKEYSVTKQNNQYFATIDGVNKLGEQTLVIEQLQLSNGKVFDFNDQYKVLVDILRQKPTINDFTSIENVENSSLTVNFSLHDEDHAVKGGVVVLYNQAGIELSRELLTSDDLKNPEKITKSLNTSMASSYKVKVEVKYTQTGEDKDIVSTVLLEKDIQAEARVIINKIVTDQLYFEKEGVVTLTYEISTNKIEDVSKILINSSECLVKKLANGQYEVSYVLDKTSGIKELQTSKITFSDNTTSSVNQKVKVEVLKDIPSITNIVQTDHVDTSEVTMSFDVVDQEHSFLSGEVVMTNQKDHSVVRKEIKNGNNRLTFEVVQLVDYKFDVYVTYDRDTNSLEGTKDEDNVFENHLLETRKVNLISDYQLQINDIKTYSSVETKYFAKDEAIILDFTSSNISTFEPVKAIINKKEYILTKVGNRYRAQLAGYSEAGVKDIQIESITLSNTKELEVSKNNLTKIEVLKDKPNVKNFDYKENADGTMIITFDIEDQEESIKNSKIVITNNNNVVMEQVLNRNQNTISVKTIENESYQVKVMADYDLDTNTLSTNENEYYNITLFEQLITTGKRRFEVKDITSFSVYKQTSEGVVEVLSLKEADLSDLNHYIVKVNTKKMPTFYTTIEEYHVENNQLKLTLNYDNVVQYNGDVKQNKLEVVYGDMRNGVAENISLETLLQRMEENPNGTFELTRDYDASTISVNSNTLVSSTFTGTLNGNGHKIYNLNKPLFNSLDGATVKGIILEDVVLSGANSKGTIANTAQNTKIKNVHVKGLKLTTGADHTGGIVGDATATDIEQSSVTNFTITTAGHIRISAIFGRLTGGSIKNCYVEGVLNSKQSKDGNGIGGVLGHGFGVITIENCIVKVSYTNNVSHRLNGGIVGILANKSSILRNNVSLSTGTNFYSIHGNEPNSNSTNNYELVDSGLTSNVSGNRVLQVSKNDINRLFYKEKANFDESIWDLGNTSYDKIPVLKNDDPNRNDDEQTVSEDLYIPDYSRIKKINGYTRSKEILYHNLNKLMPYYDAKYLVEDGMKIDVDHLLNTKIIKHIFAYNENDKQVIALSQNEQQKIKKIRILFADDETITYNVTYKENNQLISIYDINDLGIDYSFDKYLVNTSSEVYNYIVNYIKKSDYVTGIATLTEEEELRNYIDNYPKVKERAEEFAINLMANVGDLSSTTSSSVLQNKLLQDLTKERTLDKFLYAYNYYDRFYNFEIGGLNIRDIIFFDGRLFSDNFNAVNMTNSVINTTTAYRLTSAANNFYTTYIQPSTGKSIYYFVDYFIEKLTNDQYKNDTASWIIDNYQGTIYEAVPPRYPEIRSRVWDHLKARPQLILYILSYPGDDLYVLGAPTTLFVGNLRMYYSNYAIVSKETKYNFLKNYADNYLVPFYDTVAGVVEGTKGYTNLANFTQISYDSTHGKDWSADPNADPVFKYFYEARNQWLTKPAGSAAYANGTDMFWMAHKALTDFVVFSHEAVHNQDNRIFLQGTGRRRGAGAEHFTDNFLTQPYPNAVNGAYGVVPNYTYTRPIISTITTNLTKERINTRAKIESYYKGMYDTFAFLDYIEAQAFLQLTPEEQAKIAQVTTDAGARVTKTAEEFKAMNLKTIEDIWDNKLAIIRGNKAYTTGSMWYIYENPNVGAGLKANFVLNAYQFLADFGYDGYVGYAGNSNGSLTDGQILKKISGDPNITWKSYQLGRYENVAKQIKTYAPIDVDDAINKTLEAMRLDVKNNKPIDINSNASVYREALYGYLKRVTNDFESSIYDQGANTIHVSSATEFIERLKNNPELNVVLDKDLDFSNISVDDTTQSLISTFVGTLDGNHHKITGLTRPLFGTMVFAYVKDLKIENSNVVSGYNTAGALGKTMTFSFIDNVSLKNVNVTGTNIVGGIVGNATKTTVDKVSYENVNVSSSNNKDTIGGVFGISTYSSITNTHGINSTMSGNGNVGGMVGNANTMYEISNCSFNGTIINKGNQAGGIVGNLQNSTVRNSYVLGNVSGNGNVGGIAGNIATSNISNTFSNAIVKGNALSSTGGLFGNVASGTFTNNLSLGRVNNGYKVYGNSTKAIVESGFSNNYELAESIGHTTFEKTGIDFSNRITSVNITNLNHNFYTNTLKFNSDIWDLSNVASGGLPKLKNNDPNNVKQIIAKTEINSIADFMKINDNADGDYILTRDLDFSGFSTTNNATSVITTTFIGRIDGNGHTISNLTNASLFTKFSGDVSNLKVKNFTYTGGDMVVAFAKESSNAKFDNMEFSNITLQGTHRVAVVVGTDNANSTFERISVKNANIKATGVYISALVGRKYGGSIKNCYVQGNMEITATSGGGIMGTAENSVSVSNVVSNINIARTSNSERTLRQHNGGIVGFLVSNSNRISNSISVGNMTGYVASGVEVNSGKVVGQDNANDLIIPTFANCYEYQVATGVSNAIGEMIKIATKANINSKAFYKDVLNFDEKIWSLDNVATKGYPELR